MTTKEELDKIALEKHPVEMDGEYDKNQYVRQVFINGYLLGMKSMIEEKVKIVECPDCDGDGEFYVDTSSQCTTRMNDCCGGCGYDVTCETCDGTGEVEE